MPVPLAGGCAGIEPGRSSHRRRAGGSRYQPPGGRFLPRQRRRSGQYFPTACHRRSRRHRDRFGRGRRSPGDLGSPVASLTDLSPSPRITRTRGRSCPPCPGISFVDDPRPRWTTGAGNLAIGGAGRSQPRQLFTPVTAQLSRRLIRSASIPRERRWSLASPGGTDRSN